MVRTTRHAVRRHRARIEFRRYSDAARPARPARLHLLLAGSERMGRTELSGRDAGLAGPGVRSGAAAALAYGGDQRHTGSPGGYMRPESALLAVGLCARLAAQSLAATPDANDPFTPAQRKYWAFQAVRRVDPPPVRDANWAASPIDLFILAKLEAKGLKPSPPADRITLIRRLSFDLIGLPPSPEEVDAFVKDPSPDAYERVVDRLLASPHYGERWARHWLDLARYAESEGFKSDETRPNAWRYRDYVIKAFNQNKPYDRFIKEQIAGDELWPGDPEARVATAFNRHYPDESNARNLMQRRQEILDDITDTVGATFMALTYGCARCHTHHFDPILHSDYYRLQAFFANTAADDEIPMAGPEEAARYRAQKAVWQEKTKPIRDQ